MIVFECRLIQMFLEGKSSKKIRAVEISHSLLEWIMVKFEEPINLKTIDSTKQLGYLKKMKRLRNWRSIITI